MFLEKIVNSTQKRVNKIKESFDFPFEKVLKQKGMSFICEVKKASPSLGIIAEDFPYIQISKDYENAGASAISVLTEPDYFLGKGEYLEEISNIVKIPTLRKDFIIDSFQIYEAKIWGASAVLLIAEILTEQKLSEFIKIANNLGLSALVESHSLKELQKSLRAGATIIGVNNRNLETFEVDINTSKNLREYVSSDKIFVAESGIKTAEDVEMLFQNGVDAVLIGESLMKSSDKKSALQNLRSKL